MFEKILRPAFDAGTEVFVFVNGFAHPLRGRIQDMADDHFTFFQSGRSGTVLWAFKLEDVLSCGLIVTPPSTGDEVEVPDEVTEEESSLGYFNESDN